VTLLYRIEQELGIRIADTFDMFAGTSTGSIIASGLAGLDLSMEQITNYYSRDTMEEIMHKDIIDRVFGIYQLKSKYTDDGKSGLFQSNFKKILFKQCHCPLIIPTYNITKRTAQIFSTSNTPDSLIWEVVNASSAAPIFYPPYQIGEDWYVDGGVSCNDPCMVSYTEALKLWGKEEDIRVLSIGTGRDYTPISGEKAQEWGALEWISEGKLIDILLYHGIDEQITKNVMDKNFLRIQGDNHKYGVSTHMDDYSMNNYTKMIHMGDELWKEYKDEIIHFLIAESLY